MPLMLEKVEASYRYLQSTALCAGSQYPRFIKYLSEIHVTDSDQFWRSKLSEITAAQFPSLPHLAYQIHATSIATRSIYVSREAGTQITLPSTIRAAWALVLG